MDLTENGQCVITTESTGAPESRSANESTLHQRVEPSSTGTYSSTASVIGFVATASPGTFLVLALAFSLFMYVALGGIGLLLIGACGGVLLYVAFEASHPDVARAIRGDKGYDVISRLISLPGAEEAEANASALRAPHEISMKSFEDFRPETRDALKSLIDAILRDYIKWWYSPIVPSDRSFPLACRKLLSSFVISTANHLSRKRPASVFLDFFTNSSSILIVLCSELSAAFAELPPDSKATPVDAVYAYLTSNPDSHLANLINQKQQASKLKMAAEDLLGFLEKPAYDCEIVRMFLKEILAGVILESTLSTCSKPEWINGWIVYLLEDGEPDFNQAIDVGMQTGRDANTTVFADVDSTSGAVTVVRAAAPDVAQIGKKENLCNHKKQLSKADEDMEEALEEMKRMNALLVAEDANCVSDTTSANGGEVFRDPIDPLLNDIIGHNISSNSLGNISPRSSHVSIERASVKGTGMSDPAKKGEQCHTRVAAQSTDSNSAQNGELPKQVSRFQFTSFDQIVPPAQETSDGSDEPRPATLTLQNATITIHEDAINENGLIRNKPSWDYLIQIEPCSSRFPGWMIIRKYSDFEALHEILRRIATVSGAIAFSEQHSALASWKVHTRSSLRGELERYVRDACWYSSLAESEGMKRFLDKDQGLPSVNDNRTTFGLDIFGKNMLDVLATAPKGAMQGGKAVVGGVTGVLGNIGLGQRKPTQPLLRDLPASGANRLAISTPPRINSMPSPVHSQKARDSMDSQRSSVISIQPAKIAPMERRPSSQFDTDGEAFDTQRSPYERPDSMSRSNDNSRSSSRAPLRSSSLTSLDCARPPPLTCDSSDDQDVAGREYKECQTNDKVLANSNYLPPFKSTGSTTPSMAASKSPEGLNISKHWPPLSEQEASIAVELMFAVINELYTLSSAWNIRRTLLGAAKSFLLRPGNPSLLSIRSLLQHSIIDANTCDSGIASHLHKLRENSLPTEEEKAAWPSEMTQSEKDKLREKARKLLIQSGVPAALTGVMGQSATNEAVGRVFDCLQIEEIARGLMFGILLQAVRAVTH